MSFGRQRTGRMTKDPNGFQGLLREFHRKPGVRADKSKSFRGSEFRKIEREWYAKLRATGFEDIEHNESSPFIKDNHLRIRRRVRRGWRTGQQALYEVAADYLSGATASRRSERIHAALFVAGMPPAKIAERFGIALRGVQKHCYSLIAKAKEYVAQAKGTEQQTEDGSEAQGGLTENDAAVDLSYPSSFP